MYCIYNVSEKSYWKKEFQTSEEALEYFKSRKWFPVSKLSSYELHHIYPAVSLHKDKFPLNIKKKVILEINLGEMIFK